jgi:hypothetical protein
VVPALTHSEQVLNSNTEHLNEGNNPGALSKIVSFIRMLSI